MTTDYLRWTRDERPALFSHIQHADTTEVAGEAWIASVGRPELVCFLKRMKATGRTIGDTLCDGAGWFVCAPRASRYFISAVPVDLNRRNQEVLRFATKAKRDYALAILNSNVFYWYWRAISDGFWVTHEHLAGMPIPRKGQSEDEIRSLGEQLWNAADECRASHVWCGKRIATHNFNKRMDILIDIDDWIVKQVAPDMDLPRDIFAQYKSNSFLHPENIPGLGGSADAGDEELE